MSLWAENVTHLEFSVIIQDNLDMKVALGDICWSFHFVDEKLLTESQYNSIITSGPLGVSKLSFLFLGKIYIQESLAVRE